MSHRLVAFACLLISVTVFGRQPIPFEAEFGRPEFSRFSPPTLNSTGRWIAYELKVRGESMGSQLFITEIETQRTQRLCGEKFHCSAPTWSPDGKQLAFLSDEEGGFRVWIFDLEKAKSRRVSDLIVKDTGLPRQIHWHDDKLFVATPPPVSERTIESPKVFRSGREVGPSTRPQSEIGFSGLSRVEISSGASKEIVSASSNPAPFVFQISASGRWVSYLSLPHSRLNSEAMSLVVTEIASGRTQVIVTGLDYLNDAELATIYAWDPKQDRLLFEKKGKRFWVDFNSGASSEPKPATQNVSDLTAQPSDEVLLIQEDFNNPPDLFLANRKSKVAPSRLTRIDPARIANSGDFFAYTETRVTLFNGKKKKIRTAVLMPQGSKKGDRLPAVVIGYPGDDLSKATQEFGGGTPGATLPARLFTSRGFAVVLVDLPIRPPGQPGNPLKETVDVLLPQVREVAAQGYIDLKRMAFIGQSYGGYAAAGIITRTPIFRAAVAMNGFYDLIGRYGNLPSNGSPDRQTYMETGQGRMGAPPWKDPKRYIENSPYLQATRIKTPLLILHGDPGVEEATKLFAALRRVGATVQLAVYPGEPHGVSNWSRPKATDAAARVIEFLQRYLRD